MVLGLIVDQYLEDNEVHVVPLLGFSYFFVLFLLTPQELFLHGIDPFESLGRQEWALSV
jgi:hypothetical protein